MPRRETTPRGPTSELGSCQRDRGLAVGSLIGVDDALRSGLVEGAVGGLGEGLGLLSIASLNGLMEAADEDVAKR